MLWNASALSGYPIKATDGQLGTVAGLMYDDSDWAIRWVMVGTGGWRSGRRVLLPVAALSGASFFREGQASDFAHIWGCEG